MPRQLLFVVFILAMTGGGIGLARGQSVLEHLVSPGALSSAHQRLEGQCSACHAPFDKGAQSRLCAGCHKPVAQDIAARRGFHGRRAQSTACKACHVEHRGRGVSSVAFDRKTFDHRLTDYPLKGAHARLACQSCHRSGVPFRVASTTCLACHGKRDPHQGSLGPQCQNCHDENAWKPARFDHSRTRFALTGAHARVQCSACHAGPRFGDTATDCVSCHRKADAHAGRFGSNCGACHGTAVWTTARFDHGRTGFPLAGRHAAVACTSCHVQPAAKVRLSRDCSSCHARDDVHRGKNGSNCGSCHGVAGWKTASFDHARMTSFPLLGRHASLACAACHIKPATQVKLDPACGTCHRKDDVHAGQLGVRCAQCHAESGWSANVRFDHDLAGFPLLGRHAQLACASCHASKRYKDASNKCIDCHRDQDRHQGALGTGCGQCHNPNAWASWSFDHASQTSFALTGAHGRVACEGCHRSRQTRLSKVCGDCHRREDIHQGSFGLNCDRCHVTDTFANVRSHF